ncbi:rhamnogalacturonan acetylesterase [Dyadobacter luteus]|jgi:lysophospholipase L1-like esterase|uniref:Rhamnogalacturonan acetylesterase n=1 Tax=Dyadobacter luteus TaxID=2259619 RepID=A0A3D8Y4A6_9BACT|nr:rhamnogalacturonan acetylesterase [Dyadobacter luteus]REA56892.1 rhamnogalacturonan acetylesterase [Dyadobacter luteus]
MTALFSYFKKSNVLICFILTGIVQNVVAQPLRFDFGTGKTEKGYTRITPEDSYTSEKGYGFLSGIQIKSISQKGKDQLRNDYITADSAFFFSVKLPEGNYDIRLLTGDANGTSHTTVKVECRRLMIEGVATSKGEFKSSDFTVNLRSPKINETEKIALKPRELDYLHWDDQLTFEFTGKQPKICTLEIVPNETAKTIFLAGNSTVVDQANEPYASWGQMIPRFFQPGSVVVANYAESGESLRSFNGAKRSAKIFSQMKKGDYLFIEFAHNDQKQKDLQPFVGYKALLEGLIEQTRAKGGIPLLVTSMHRRNFDSTGHIINTLGDFPEAVRLTAKEHQVALIDLNAMSKILWETLGEEESKKAFVHVAANTIPGRKDPIADNTHFSNYGAYQLARCIIEGIRKADSQLASYLVPGIPAYDPATPTPIDTFDFPQSPLANAVKPDGN